MYRITIWGRTYFYFKVTNVFTKKLLKRSLYADLSCAKRLLFHSAPHFLLIPDYFFTVIFVLWQFTLKWITLVNPDTIFVFIIAYPSPWRRRLTYNWVDKKTMVRVHIICSIHISAFFSYQSRPVWCIIIKKNLRIFFIKRKIALVYL